MPRINVYADESRTHGERFMLIGGLWVPVECESCLREDILKLRNEANMTSELKWTKVSRGKLSSYKKFIDIFFRQRSVSFHCIVIDKTKLDCKTFAQGDKELLFYKFYFQLISRKLKEGNEYFVFTDARNNRKRDRLTDLQMYVNNWWNRHKVSTERPVRIIQARDSKHEDLIQLCDVILGAVGYAWNKHEGSPAKLELIKHITNIFELPYLRIATLPSREKFNIWFWKPSARSIARKRKKHPGS